MEYDKRGDVSAAFIRKARMRINLAALFDFADSLLTQLTVGVLSQ